MFGQTNPPQWNRIDSPLALKLVEYAYRANASTSYGYSHYEAGEYRQWVADQLRRQRFAELIAYCNDFLPDITTVMPLGLRTISSVGKPRNYRQLIRQLVTFLDWYLEPTNKFSVLGRFEPDLDLFTRCLLWAAAFVAAGIVYAAGYGEQLLGLGMIVGILLFRFGRYWLPYLGVTSHRLARRLPVGVVRKINAEELYHHLLRTYTMEDDKPVENLPRELEHALHDIRPGIYQSDR